MGGWADKMLEEQQATFKAINNGACGCHRCIKERGHVARHMITCEICGNKRCPHATDHRLVCTYSNEPGQPGSVYE